MPLSKQNDLESDPAVNPIQGEGESVGVAQGMNWRVVGAAVRGVSHERIELPCQDAQDWRVLPSGALVIALADGAGSAAKSDSGAQKAVETVISALANALEGGAPEGEASWASLLREAFADARQSVLDLANVEEEPPREYASTLTCAVASGDRLVVGQIGDGAVVVEDESGALFAATRLQRGEYANETHFLIQEDALEQVTIETFERSLNGLAVMSDGLIRLALKMPDQQPHAPFFQPLFRFARAVEPAEQAACQLAEFLGSERVNARTDDDKALVLAVRVASNGNRTARAAGTEDAPAVERKMQ